MSNIAISELNSEATVLNDNDLLLVSKQSTDGTMYTSMKMKGSVLKTGTGTCSFSSSAVKQACSEAIQQSTISSGGVIDLTKGNTILSGETVYGETKTLHPAYSGILSIQVDGWTFSELETIKTLVEVSGDGNNWYPISLEICKCGIPDTTSNGRSIGTTKPIAANNWIRFTNKNTNNGQTGETYIKTKYAFISC